MSRKYGTQWQPCERTNGRIMMRINPEPVVLTAEDIVEDLTYRAMDFCMLDDILKMNKTQFKNELVDIANRRTYYHHGYDLVYHNDCAEWDRAYYLLAHKLLDFFPQFDKVMNEDRKTNVAYAHKEA
tara:strand:- start:1264 stop:1644 length:381 start_codon:yes stop_codon:yes gene_type:complete